MTSRLLETEVVTGPGADALAGPTVLGVDDEGHGGTPLVTPEPAAPPPTTTPEEAAMIGKAIATYVAFGWNCLVDEHRDELAQLAPAEQQAQLFNTGVTFVEQSATRLALKYNIRIPYQDELVVGTAVGTATLGVVGKIKKKPANGNAPNAAQAQPSSRDKRDVPDEERVARPPSANTADKPAEITL